MNRKNKKLLHQILAMILCVAMVATTIFIDRLTDISAIENDSNEAISNDEASTEDSSKETLTTLPGLSIPIPEITLPKDTDVDTSDTETGEVDLDNDLNIESGSTENSSNDTSDMLPESGIVLPETGLEDSLDNEDKTNESKEKIFTWRETTAARAIYWADNAEELMGKQWFGETIDEILQMAEDPSIDFDWESFRRGSGFADLTLDDLRILQDAGYDLEELSMTIGADLSYKSNLISGYIPNIGLSAQTINSGYSDNGYNFFRAALQELTPYTSVMPIAAGGQLKETLTPILSKTVLPTLSRGSASSPSQTWKITLGGKNAWCVNLGKHLSTNTMFEQIGEESSQNKRNAVYWFNEVAMLKDNFFYTYAQIFIWCDEYGSLSKATFVNAMMDFIASRAASAKPTDPDDPESSTWTYDNDFTEAEFLAKRKANEWEIPTLQGIYDVIAGSTAPSTYKVYRYRSIGPDYQDLITAQDATGGLVTPPPPSVDEETEVFRTRLYVQHNINGFVNNDGSGVVGDWQGFSGDPETWICVDGDLMVDCTHDTQIISYKYKLEDDHDSNLGVSFGPDLESTLVNKDPKPDKHWFTQNTSHDYTPAEAEEPEAPNPDPTTGLTPPYDDTPYLVEHGYWLSTAKYETYANHYEEPGDTDDIPMPNVYNFTLTLHYQGGWCDYYPSTTNMGNNFSNSATSFNAVRNYIPDHTGTWLDDIHARDLTSTETTNVRFTHMQIDNHYKLNSFTETTSRAAGTLSGGQGSAGSFTHAQMDGTAAKVGMYYEHLYIVTLPTPQRTGYNFLGWYTAPGDGGSKVNSTSVNGYSDAYVIKQNTTLYAHWELITKDETFYIEWVDNNNNYTTRPSAVYVELWRISEDEYQLCEGYISEYLNRDNYDHVYNFSNESATGSYKTDNIFDPNVYLEDGASPNSYNNVYSANGTFMIKVDPKGINNTGDYNNPANSNTWTFTLKNLQKYDTTKEPWIEYKYVIKEIVVESLDDTTQYYVSGKSAHTAYTTGLSNYYNISNNTTNNSGQQNMNQYNSLNARDYFTNTIVNRAMNVAGPSNWKDVEVFIAFNDGPGTTADDDIYHFRPYELKVVLYQNYANTKNGEDNGISNSGVRVIYDNPATAGVDGIKFVTQYKNAYSSTTIPKKNLANVLYTSFDNLPTMQDQSCIKIAYDVILTHGQARYRYTVDQYDEANNLGKHVVSEHYYASKHENVRLRDVSNFIYTDGIQTITDLDYDILKNEAGNVVTVAPYSMPGVPQISKSQVPNYMLNGYNFAIDNKNNIYQSIKDSEDYTWTTDGQTNRYTNNTTETAKAYTTRYQSMAYNLRYYYITEECYMTASANYQSMPYYGPSEKRTEYVFYKETLYWRFYLDINNKAHGTTLPTEYSGSASSDDRTGVYTGAKNDDYLHTNNVLTITSKVFADDDQKQLLNSYGRLDGNTNYNYYHNLKTDIPNEAFLITLKQVAKIWDSDDKNIVELNSSKNDIATYKHGSKRIEEKYNNNAYSVNGYKSTVYTGNRMTIRFVSEASATSTATMLIENIGNEYNVIVPAQGSTTIDYIPDGKYEITCHYDIDFNMFNYQFSGGNAVFSIENGKAYITLTSKDKKTTGAIIHNSTIDYWRGYVNDKNTEPIYAAPADTSIKNNRDDWKTNKGTGYNVNETSDMRQKDEKDPSSPAYDYKVPNYVSPE